MGERFDSFWLSIKNNGIQLSVLTALGCLVVTTLMYCHALDQSAANKLSAEKANTIAQDAKDISLKFSIINAETQWYQMREKYERIDRLLKNWEKENKFERTGKIPTSWNQLEDGLDQFGKELDSKKEKLDGPTISLFNSQMREKYQDRYLLYESLKNMAEHYGPFAERFKPVALTLPDPPKLPVPMAIVMHHRRQHG